MASNWFRDFDDDDFFTRPMRSRPLRDESWDSLMRFHQDFNTEDIFSDFATKAANLRDRARVRQLSPVKKSSLRRGSEQSVDGVASPTPSSVHSGAFHFPDGTQGHVSFPNSSCSNVSDCSDRSSESMCTEKSANHSEVAEALPGGGEQRTVDSSEKWVDRNETGGVVGEGSLSETVTTKVRPGSFQEYSKQERSYVAPSSGDSSMASFRTCEERTSLSSSSQNASSKTISNKSVEQSSSSVHKGNGGKPFRGSLNRSIFYDELDSSQLTGTGNGNGNRRRFRALDHVARLVDQVVHQDSIFQSELDDFLRDGPTKSYASRIFDVGGNDETLSKQGKKTIEELRRENESLHQENLRLQQVLQDVTAVNKRWQRYNNDRRMYVQKLLATIQELQEQMNQQGEAALQRTAPHSSSAPTDSSSSSQGMEVDRLKRQHEEHTQVLQMQIKSHKQDWEVERREKSNAIKERDSLVEEVKKLEQELSSVRTLLDDLRRKQDGDCHDVSMLGSTSTSTYRSPICSCRHNSASPRLNDNSHVISSQDFAPTTFQTSFQVPFSPTDELTSPSPYPESESSSYNIVEQEDSIHSAETEKMQSSSSSISYPTSPDERNTPTPRSVYLGYPNSGLATVCAFTRPGPSTQSQPANSPDNNNKDSIICPNCSRIFPPSLHSCFQDHFEFCKGTDMSKYSFS